MEPTTIIVSIIGLIGIVVTALIADNRAKERNQIEIKKLNNEWKKKYEPQTIEHGNRKNTVLIVGKGRVGKTQLVECFIKSQPNEVKLTNKFTIKSVTTEYDDSNITLHFSDYRGQNFGQLVNSFVLEQINPNTIMRYGDINSMILMVDTVPHEGEESDPEKKYPDISKERITENLEAWNRFALDAVFALLERDSLQYVCLLINKIDKLECLFDDAKETEIIDYYNGLIDTLKTRTINSNADFEVILGSAYDGRNITSVNGLKSKLNLYSVPRK